MDTQDMIKRLEKERQARIKAETELAEKNQLVTDLMVQVNLMVRDREYSDPKAA